MGQPADHDVKHRREDQTEECDTQHPEEHCCSDCVPELGAGTLSQHQRHNTQDERQRRHEDRAQAEPTGVDNGIDGRLALRFKIDAM